MKLEAGELGIDTAAVAELEAEADAWYLDKPCTETGTTTTEGDVDSGVSFGFGFDPFVPFPAAASSVVTLPGEHTPHKGDGHHIVRQGSPVHSVWASGTRSHTPPVIAASLSSDQVRRGTLFFPSLYLIACIACAFPLSSDHVGRTSSSLPCFPIM